MNVTLSPEQIVSFASLDEIVAEGIAFTVVDIVADVLEQEFASVTTTYTSSPLAKVLVIYWSLVLFCIEEPFRKN